MAWAAVLASLVACDDAPPPGAVNPPVANPALPDALVASYVKLEELTESLGGDWASVAEFNLVDATGATVDRNGWVATADSAGVNDQATNAIDGDVKTLWHTKWGGIDPPSRPPHWLQVALGRPVKISGFRYLPRQDGQPNGTIARYRFYLSTDGVNWGQPVASGDLSASASLSEEKVVIFANQTVNHIPVVQTPAAQTTSMGKPVGLQVAASDEDGDLLHYTATNLPPGLSITPDGGVVQGTPIQPGDYVVSVSISDAKAAPVVVPFSWKVLAPSLGDDVAMRAPGEVRFVKLVADSEITGQPWTSIADFNLLGPNNTDLPRSGWAASADSSDAGDRPGMAIDDAKDTFWHTQWNGVSPPPPHSFIVDIGHMAKVNGFRYLPRQDKLTNGMIAKFRFFVSVDGVNWGKPIAEGDFSSMGSPRAEKTVSVQ